MNVQETLQHIARGTTEIIGEDALAKKLQSKKKLVVKAGFDPTAPDIHLGHVVLLRKLKQFQDLGHKVVFLIGDFTALVGDPSGKSALRPKLSREDIKRNKKTYEKQVYKVLDKAKTEVVFNDQWLGKLSSYELMELSAHSTVAQMLARADFKERYEAGTEISLLEFLYPLLQGYDSVHLKADIELGGNDQKFNLLMGRHIQEVFGQEPQVIIMTPLLEGTDGVKKMSKSLDNYIGITDAPDEMFGKVMSIDDELMLKYYEYLTDLDLNEVKALHPKEAKLQLGEAIVQQFYTLKQAEEARKGFESTFSQGNVPEDIQEFVLKTSKTGLLLDVLLESGLISSKGEGRRLMAQKAVSCEGQLVLDPLVQAKKGVWKVGKRRFLRVI